MGVAVAAKKSVGVGEGVSGVEVSVGVGEDAGATVFVGSAGVSLTRAVGVVTLRLQAVSRNMVKTMKNNRKKYF